VGPAFHQGLAEGGDERGGADEHGTHPLFAGYDPERYRRMNLAGAGWSWQQA
jgi:hypothetical protein